MSIMKEMYDINDFVSVPTESKTTNDLVERFKFHKKNCPIGLVFLMQALEDLKVMARYL